MDNFFLYILTTFICIGILYIFFQSFFEKKKCWANIIIFSVYGIWQMYLLLDGSWPIYINLVISFVLNCILGGVCFKGNMWLKIALAAMLSALWTISEFFVGSVFMTLGIDYTIPKALGALISEMLILAFVICINNFFKLENMKNLPVKHYIMMLFLPIGSLFIIYKIFEYSCALKRDFVIKESLFCLLIMLFVNLLVFRLYLLLANELVKSRDNAVYEQQLQIYSQALHEKELNIEEIRNMKHDIKQHYISLRGMISKEEYKMADDYLAELLNYHLEKSSFSKTGNVIIDSIINTKYYVMKQAGIECFSEIHIPFEMNIDATDLSVLIGNVLDNAIEANYADIIDKYVKIYMNYDKNILIITVINSYDGILTKDKNGKLLSRKENTDTHGFGMNSINNIVSKYKGTMVIDNNDKEFILKMFLMDIQR